MIFDQSIFDIRCEWGENGLKSLSPISDVIIIVDVMSFSTCVSIAVSRGAVVYPFLLNRDKAKEFADSIGAIAAQARAGGLYSLSPRTMLKVEPGMKLVLPSGNGAKLSLLAGETPCLAGSLRNAKAVAMKAMSLGHRISVIPAGERWKQDESLRPAFEDWIGAGAIISNLVGNKSTEAQTAEAIYHHFSQKLSEALSSCSSGRELVAAGFQSDIASIAELDADNAAPILRNGYYSK